jgi:hypothetical protein
MASADVVLRSEDAPVGDQILVRLRRILTIAGVTRDDTGAPLGFVDVALMRSADSVNILRGTSAADGTYQFSVPGTTQYYVAAFKPYTVDDATGTADSTAFTADLTVREGVTANTLVGV